MSTTQRSVKPRPALHTPSAFSHSGGCKVQPAVSLRGPSFQFTFYLRVSQESFLPPLWKLGQVTGARSPGKVRRQTLLSCPNSVPSSCAEPDGEERQSRERRPAGDSRRGHSPCERAGRCTLHLQHLCL